MDRVQMYRGLYEKGMALIKLQRGKKIPAGAWKEKLDRSGARDSWENLNFGKSDNAGVLTGHVSGIIVLDIDYAERFPEHYEIPKTFTVQTRKGFHHYYRLPEDGQEYRTRTRGSDGFDIRANGGYVVAPGSSVNGWQYVVVSETNEITPAPDWLLEIALESARSSQRRRVDIPIDQPQELSAELREAYQGLLSYGRAKGVRSDYIWHILHQLVSDDLTDEQIISLFEAYPDGAGAKYFEKGGGRFRWLLSQLEKIRDELSQRKVAPFEASNQEWVNLLTEDILKTFTEEYRVNISTDQCLAMRQMDMRFLEADGHL